jgi:hypothetical protein
MDAKVKIVIYDILGREVQRLAEAQFSAGYYELPWRPNIASGIYLYRLEAVSTTGEERLFVSVKKMLLLK